MEQIKQKENEKSDRRIIGVLSNSQNKYKYSHFTQLIKHHIRENIGLIYICNHLEDSKYIENDFQSILGDQYEKIIEKGQIKILNRDYMEAKEDIYTSFTNFILSEVYDLQEKSFENIQIYISVDKHINSIPKDELYSMFELIATVSKEHNIQVILRFFMDEITNFDFFYLMSETGYFVVEDITKDDFLFSHYPQIVTSSNLFLDSMIQETSPPYVRNNIKNVDSFNQIIDEVSHDLKNVFATISGYTQLALAKSPSEEVKDYLKIILNNSLDIHSIFEKFKNPSSNSEKPKNKYWMNTLVMEAAEMAFNMKRNKESLGNKNISISYSLNSQGSIYCSECQMKQVIMNIVDNGIHALNGKGNIVINTYDGENKSILEIIDNGSGMDEDTKNKIFEPYFTTKKGSGMGLGLDIAKRTLGKYGATISVDSRLGFGTKFTIVFPAKNKELAVANDDEYIYNIT